MDPAALRAALGKKKAPQDDFWAQKGANPKLGLPVESSDQHAAPPKPEPKREGLKGHLAAAEPVRSPVTDGSGRDRVARGSAHVDARNTASSARYKPIQERRNAASEQRSGDIDPGMLGPKYRVIKILGEGGMGKVFEAMHLGLDRRVAVKVLSKKMAEEPRVVERLRREAETAQRVKHPNIVEFFGIERTPSGEPCVVMELLEGWNLAARIKAKGKLEADVAVQMGIEICDALSVSHNAGIVHRDVKPDNIFLTGEGTEHPSFKLLDFGAAHVVDAKTLTVEGSLIGTPAYMSPEQAMGTNVTERTDVYSTGLVLYEALTGKNPFSGGHNLEETIVRIVSHNPEPPMKGAEASEMNRALDEIVQKAIEKRPEDRWGSAAELAAALRQIAGGNAKGLKVARKRETKAVIELAPKKAMSDALKVTLIAVPIVVLAVTGYVFSQSGGAKVRVDIRSAERAGCSAESTRDVSLAMMSALERVPEVVPVTDGATFLLTAKCRSENGKTSLITTLREEKTNEDRYSVVAQGSDARSVAARAVVEIAGGMKWNPRPSLAEEASTAERVGER
ncbi:MAG: serine/threonine protein kinase [Deltaproteobacteria bacterium]|nr:serine/threonine protein kinase [Deltaproteobacteria bacterium]